MGQTDRVGVAPTGAATGEQTGHPAGRTASLGFRVAAWGTALGAVAVFVFALLEVVLMWLPDATLLSVIDELTPADLEFRVQFFAVGVAAWTVVLGLVAQLVRPARHAAGLVQAWGAAATMAVMLAVVGAFGVVDVVILLAVTVVVALHPSRTLLLARPWRLDRWQGGVLLVGVLPWLVAAGVWAVQARDSAGQPGTADVSAVALWGALATVPVLILVTALIGASDKPGWRLPAWTSVVAATALGVHAIVFSGIDGALPVPGAVAAVVWGAAFAAVTLRRARST